MKKACIVLAEGFEEIEALTVVDCLRRADIFVNVTGLTSSEFVNGAHDIKVAVDSDFDSICLSEYDILILPGGGMGTCNLSNDERIADALEYMRDSDKYLAAICAAPIVFGKYGILNGKKACCYPGFEEKLKGASVSFNPVEVDDKIITARAMGVSIGFSMEIIKALCGESAAIKVAESILYN